MIKEMRSFFIAVLMVISAVRRVIGLIGLIEFIIGKDFLSMKLNKKKNQVPFLSNRSSLSTPPISIAVLIEI